MSVRITSSSPEFRVLHSQTQTLRHERELATNPRKQQRHQVNSECFTIPLPKKPQKRRATPRIFQIETEYCINYLKTSFPGLRQRTISFSRCFAPLSRRSTQSQLTAKKLKGRSKAMQLCQRSCTHIHMASDDADFAAAIALSLADSSSPCSNAAHVKLPEGSNPHVLIHNTRGAW